jgi:hypothetical protein
MIRFLKTMNSITITFKDNNIERIDAFINFIKTLNFIDIKESNLENIGQSCNEDDILPNKPIPIADIKQLFPDEWILLAEPKFKDNQITSGIVLFHDKDKRNLALANQKKQFTKKYKQSTHFYTGVLPKINLIGIYKRISNETV